MAANGQDVGIRAMEIYFPKMSVKQADLEESMGVSKGKFTTGLGQTQMAFTTDREDATSICMTAAHNLLDKYNISPLDVGRVEVGTETLHDKSKSVKTALCSLFHESGNFDIEGIDNVNACYGGTAALLNSIAWCQSSACDGRYALVVCGDIAVYEQGPARPTGGCAAVAMLIGPGGSLVMEPVRSSHMEHVYDFFKPSGQTEYPTVFGHESNDCYLRALDSCYHGFRSKYAQLHEQKDFDMTHADFAVFHAPYNKLVQKSFSRLMMLDFIRDPTQSRFADAAFQALRGKSPEALLDDVAASKLFIKAGASDMERMAAPSMMLPKQLGNSYTASLYVGLLSLLEEKYRKAEVGDATMHNSRVLMFSYGSGLAATMFSLCVTSSEGKIPETVNVTSRLKDRKVATISEYYDAMALREQRHGTFDYVPSGPIDAAHMFPGTYYIDKVDHFGRRYYGRTAKVDTNKHVTPLASAKFQPAPVLSAFTHSSFRAMHTIASAHPTALRSVQRMTCAFRRGGPALVSRVGLAIASKML